MLKAIAFGLAAGAGFQALRNYPPDGPLSQAGVAVVLLAAVVCAFLAGVWRRRASASAWASAHAEATATATSEAVSASSSTAQQQVNVAVVFPGGGAGSGAGRVPGESAPWVLDPSSRSASLDDYEGLDLAELIDQREQDPA